MLPRIVLTSGEPAGIGPDLCLAIAARALECELVCLGDLGLLRERARRLSLGVQLREYRGESRPHAPGTLLVADHRLVTACEPGRLDARNAPYVLGMLARACDATRSGEFQALVTAPVHKGVINDAGIPFTGHTEYLAERTHAARPVMMLTTGSMRVALATTHLPLRAVSEAISTASLCEILEVLDRDLAARWRIRGPRITVCGLNPHAGEGGHLGDEEIRIIAPAVARMRERGLAITGPVPADTAFLPAALERCDAVLAMYHDQGLPVIKHAGFQSAVNVTLGLPIVRTSVDHGTALELAGSGKADAGSLAAALELAVSLAGHAA